MRPQPLRPLAVLSCCFVVACADPDTLAPTALMEGAGDARGVRGLERLGGAGTYVAGQSERFRVHVDPAVVQRVEFSASSGALSASGLTAEWTLPASSLAELSARIVRRDSSDGQVTWQFAIQSPATGRTQSAQAALLATPMPVLDGGTLEVSGGACDVKYEGTTNNVAIAFTTATHPALMYGRWNGSTWALEVVDAMGFNRGGVVEQHVQLQVEANGTPHLLHLRDRQVFYATKSGASWLRERVDSPTEPLTTSSTDHAWPTLTLGLSGAPSIVYGVRPTLPCGTFTCERDRLVVAVRSAPGSWTRSLLSLPLPISTNGNQSLSGDVTFDGSRLLFPAAALNGSFSAYFLIGWTPSGTTVVSLPTSLGGRASMWATGSTRAYLLSGTGVHDVALSTPLSASTIRQSLVEVFSTSQHAVAADSAGLPRLVVNHGNELESVWAGPDGFWRRVELGDADPGHIDVAVDAANETRACFVRARKLMVY
ncbi:MAG: hypothetical protein INH41_18540 [Myxococcaceae bacterium]|nr:hypothetical protein [Myxococcaceae bacterium]